MKKPLLIPLILCLAAVLAGCSPGELADNLLRHGDRAEETTPPKERVYMDAISGQLASFDGTTMVLISDNLHYTFDLSEATLECRHGILSGSKISVIYEGRMNDNDTSTVKALKVADVIHGMEEPKDQMVTGHIQNMSTYYCTFRTEDGKLITFPITGAKQYYQNGLNSDSLMYLHYIGDLVWQEGSDRADASHVRVVSISDVDPYKAPAWKELVDGLDNKNYSNNYK